MYGHLLKLPEKLKVAQNFYSNCPKNYKLPEFKGGQCPPGPPTSYAYAVEDPKRYCPISLLCIPYKILERLIHVRVKPIVDPLLPREQVGFQLGGSIVNQIVLLTQNIEDSFEAKKKAGAVFVNLTAAYDAV